MWTKSRTKLLGNMKEYYFFFDKDGMPIAVFLTEFQDEAMYLFSRLYKQKWPESVKAGITVEKESEVPEEWWDEIHRRRVEAERPAIKKAPVILKSTAAIKIAENRRAESSGLETEKYMTRWQ